MKTPLVRRVLSGFLLGAALVFSAPVFGQDTTDMLSKALDLVHQVENPTGNPPPTDAQRIDLLTQAIKLAQEAPNHRLKGHRVLAIQAIRTAIVEIQSGDPDHQAAASLRTADTELTTSVSLARDTAAPAAPPTNTPAATPPAVAPSSPTSTPDVSAATALPPGVTPEMEQAFLAKYKAALEKPDPDAYMALVANDPHLDPKAKEAMKGFELFGVAMTLSNPNRTYAFVPLSSIPVNGSDNSSTELAGKMYDGYLPPVLGLKITFGKPAHSSPDAPVAVGDTFLPLCMEDHQLMLCGFKEIPGAVPPPAVDKTANFGIEPNLRKIDEQADDPNSFTSLGQFLASLKQPAVQVLDSGESTYEYYAICRIAPNLCVWAGGDKVGEKNYTFYFRATDSNQQELNGSQKWIRLVDVPTDNGQAPNVQGTVFFVPDHYSGPITLKANYGDDSDTKSFSFSRTILWK